MNKIKLAVLASGNGSNFEAIVKHFESRSNVEITCICDNSDAMVLKRAEKLGINSEVVLFEDNLDYFSKNKFDLCAMAGYMRILPKEVLELSTFVNIHPSLLPSFKGFEAIKKAYDYGVKITGITIHYASEIVDEGKIITQAPVQVEFDMNLAELKEKIHQEEHRLYPMVIESLLYEKIIEFQAENSKCSSGGCSGGCSGCES